MTSCPGCRYRQEVRYPDLTLAICEQTGRIVGIDCSLGQYEEEGCPRRAEVRQTFEGAIA